MGAGALQQNDDSSAKTPGKAPAGGVFLPVSDHLSGEHQIAAASDKAGDASRLLSAAAWSSMDSPGQSGSRVVATPPEVANLVKSAQAMQPPEQFNKFNTALSEFREKAVIEGLSSGQQSAVIEQIAKLISAGQEPPAGLTQADLNNLATDILHLAAHPDRVDQGNHQTCSVAALESVMFQQDPLDAIKLIVDSRLNGAFQTTEGEMVLLDSQLLQPDYEARQTEHQDGRRTYASQIFQNVALRLNTPGFGEQPGTRADADKETVRAADGQEALFNGISADELWFVNKKIAGDRNRLVIIESGRRLQDGIDYPMETDEAAVRKELKQLQENNQFPVICTVNFGYEPFYTDSNIRQTGGAVGGHNLVLKNYDESSDSVAINNQWGNESDHGHVPLADLYAAMSGAYQTFADQNKTLFALDRRLKAQGHPDPLIALDLLQRKYVGERYSPAEFEQAIMQVVLSWKRQARHLPATGSIDDMNGMVRAAVLQMVHDESERDRLLKVIDNPSP